jgi:hypothetical protein
VAVTIINTSGNTSFPTDRRFDLQSGQISTKSEAMRLVWNGLIRRDTTEERDLPLILANLLGFRASDILQSDRPVATIIGSLRNIPVGLLYNTGRRLRPVPASGVPASQSGSQPIVKADSQPGGDVVNERLKTVIKGICFIMEAAVDDLRQNRSATSGVALAIVDESPEELTTIFHSAIRVEIGNAQDSAGDISGLPVIHANYSGPGHIVMLYSEYSDRYLSRLTFRPRRARQSVKHHPYKPAGSHG